MNEQRKNPRTWQLLRLSGGRSVRLQAADRAFLTDLARVGIIDDLSASRFHYAHLKNGAARSIARLEAAGLVTSSWVRVKGEKFLCWSFASREIARAWGGVLPVTGARRSVFHELLVSRLYFELDRPDDFRIAASFSSSDVALCGSMRPDAMCSNADGEVVFVEADSGHYTRTQIRAKMGRWQGFKQIWGQPARASAPVLASSDVAVIQI